MCDCGSPGEENSGQVQATGEGRPGHAERRRWGRREVLRTSALGGGVLGAALASPPALASPAVGGVNDARAAHSDPARRRGLELVLLGTGAGPLIDPQRAGTSSALIVDGRVYLVDAGLGAARQFGLAGLDRSALRHMFITHLHSDHLMSYYDFFLTAADARDPVTVHGPGSAGALPFEERGSTPGTVDPRNPTPGLKQHTEDCHAAFAYSTNVFMRDIALADPRDLADVHEIGLPDVGASAHDPAPRTRPFPVMEDDRVKVTATLVPHGPLFPSLAFRFDTEHGSVTFSGDTRPTPNLVELARDTDLLVHEAMGDSSMEGPGILARHMRRSHTALSQVGGVAQRIGARRLVLSHIGEKHDRPIDAARWTRTVKRTYDGPVTTGQDLMRFTVSAKS
ncbi:MBL fold metallo-hydrolase [Streptomyces sp. NPDC050610]|uniref:MBL fold metallo-hydrolase n=1 Tax=Streptomyces sp. NPDC050610 TaxID=3157097 RepID=UPI00343502EF